MDLPRELRWIEVDYPKIIERKESRLREATPRCRPERVALDLAQAAKRRLLLSRRQRRASGHSCSPKGSCRICARRRSGCSPTSCARSDPCDTGSSIYFSPTTLGMHFWLRMNMPNAPFHFDSDDYFTFFRRHGWTPREIRYLSDQAKKCDRPLEAPLKLRLTRLFMRKSRRKALNRSAAYVLFEPAEPTGP